MFSKGRGLIGYRGHTMCTPPCRRRKIRIYEKAMWIYLSIAHARLTLEFIVVCVDIQPSKSTDIMACMLHVNKKVYLALGSSLCAYIHYINTCVVPVEKDLLC